MYRPVLDAVGGSLALTALVAMLPLLTLFVLLGVLKMAAWKAAAVSLVISLLVAIVAYSMPVGQALMSGTEGAAFGFFPIMWIVINGIWVYNMTVVTGHFDVLRRSFAKVSDDQRIQAIIVAFCFGALLEALAGFGTPVAFGSLAVPITTLATVTGMPEHHLAQIVGRQTPLLAIFVPMALVFIIDGWRGVRATLPATLTVGISFAIAQFVCANFISTQLTDIVASLVAAACLMLLLRVWRPAGTYVEAEELGILATEADTSGASRTGSANRPSPAMAAATVGLPEKPVGPVGDTALGLAERDRLSHDTRSDVFKAYVPYLIIITVFSIAQIPFIKDALAAPTVSFKWPGLDLQSASGKPSAIPTFKFNFFAAAGTLLVLSGLITIPFIGISVAKAFQVLVGTYI